MNIHNNVVCMFYLVFTIFSLLSTIGHSTSRRMTTFEREALSEDININNVTTTNNNSNDHVGAQRFGPGHRCSESDINVDQGATTPLPSGIPTYTVIIVNACVSGCTITDIHLRCGWFSSAKLIDPTIFRRLQFDDCLVNDGKPLEAGQSLTFQYAETFRYQLSVSSVVC